VEDNTGGKLKEQKAMVIQVARNQHGEQNIPCFLPVPSSLVVHATTTRRLEESRDLGWV
jgi:hypothetical protein